MPLNKSRMGVVHNEPTRRRLLSILAVTLVAAGAVTYFLLLYAQERIIEHQAVTLAESVARLATVARTTYAHEVAEKLARDGFGPHSDYRTRSGYVPLPAQFLKLVGEAASRDSERLYRYRPLSKWNLEPTQGLRNDFHHWGWAQLESQDRSDPTGPIEWHPIWRFESDRGVRTLRFMRADPASAPSCVTCHNAFERRDEIKARRVAAGVESGKQWRQHQLMGAIEVTIPLQKVEAMAAAQTRMITAGIIASVLLGLSISGWLMIRDIGQSRRLLELSWQATHDPLTGLANRLGFETALSRLPQVPLLENKHHALCFFDLDNFKAINDKHGHEAGDKMLEAIAAILKNEVRTDDTLARLGGDEFALILTGCETGQASHIAENLRRTIADTSLRWHDSTLHTTASIGLVNLGTAGIKSTREIMRAADRACYQAKRSGRNRVVTTTL